MSRDTEGQRQPTKVDFLAHRKTKRGLPTSTPFAIASWSFTKVILCIASTAPTATWRTAASAGAGCWAIVGMQLLLLLLCCACARALTWTHLGINGQLWQFESGTRILVDPILEGDLSFFGLPGLYTATQRVPCGSALRNALLAGDFDALLLSQGWEDHAHPPTLTALKAAGALGPGVPIIGPPSAAKAVASCGLSGSFVELAHGGSQRVRDVTVRALPGALLGPPWARRENALCVTGGGEPSDGGLFYEPHGEWGADPSLAELAPEVSILVAPAVAI